MNILTMVHDMIVPNTGGGAPRTEAAIKAFRRKGHNIFVLAPIGVSKENAEKELGAKIIDSHYINRNDPHKIIKSIFYNPILIIKTLLTIRKYKINLIFVHDSVYGFPAVVTSKVFGIPVVFDSTDLLAEYVKVTETQNIFSRLVNFVENYTIKNSTKIITVSKIMKDILRKRGGKNIDVVYDGVDFDVFRVCKPKYKKKDKFVLIYEGGMDPQDGLEIIIPTAKRVSKKIPNIKFWLVGDGKVVPKLKEEIKMNNLEKYFLFTGWIPFEKVTRYISDADVGLVIMPNILSARIRVTLKTFEYWACKKPIIVARLSALEEIVNNNTGLFYKADDSNDLTNKIIKIYNNKKLLKKLEINGYKEVKKFEWQKLGMEIAKSSLKVNK